VRQDLGKRYFKTANTLKAARNKTILNYNCCSCTITCLYQQC